MALISYVIIDFILNFCIYYIIPEHLESPFYVLFTCIETFLFGKFFSLIINKSSRKRELFWLTTTFIALLVIYYSFSYLTKRVQDPLDSIPIGIETILIFIFAFFYFHEQLNITTDLFIYSTPQFWGVLGIILYLAGSFFIYIFANQLNSNQLNKYWVITNIASIFKNLFFALAIYLQATKTPPRKPNATYNLYPIN